LNLEHLNLMTDSGLSDGNRWGAAKSRNIMKWKKMPTIRQKIMSLLSQTEMSAREISGELRIAEKEVCAHLTHIARSVSSQGKKIVTTPAICLICGYEFENRRRFTRPGRCPQCKKAHLQSPLFRIR
jgi:hypothetical protein